MTFVTYFNYLHTYIHAEAQTNILFPTNKVVFRKLNFVIVNLQLTLSVLSCLD